MCTSRSASNRLARWLATIEMKPGARPHCGAKATFELLAIALTARVRLHVLGQVEIVRADIGADLRHAGIEEEGQGGEHGILALRDLGQGGAVADVDLVRPGAVAGGLFQEGGVAVGQRDVIGAAAMEQVDDGAADLAGAEDQDFSGHAGVLCVAGARRRGRIIPWMVRP